MFSSPLTIGIVSLKKNVLGSNFFSLRVDFFSEGSQFARKQRQNKSGKFPKCVHFLKEVKHI